MDIKIELNIKVTNTDIKDIIDTANYGISYWAQKAIVKDDGYDIQEDESGKWFKLSYEDILKGIKLYIQNGNTPYNIIDFVNCKPVIDTCMVDAMVADLIIQYSCFGEIIYG